MSFDILLKITVRYLGTIATCIVLSLLVSLGALFIQNPEYQGSTTAYVTAGESSSGAGASSNEYSNSILAQTKVKSFVPLFTSQSVAERVIEKLNLDYTPSELSSRITARRVEDTVTLQITARADSPERAQAISDEVVIATSEEMKRLEGDSTTKITKVSSAQLSSTPVSPDPKRYIGAGLLVGIVLGYLVAYFRARYDTRIRTSEDLEGRVSQPVLGVLPESDGIRDLDFTLADDFRAREALRKLRTNLRYANIDEQMQSVVITSPTMNDGKSSVAAFLGVVLAEAGSEVLLVDTDLRRPTVADKFQADGSVGLTQVLAGIASLSEAIQKTSVQGLSILPAGEVPANPSEILGSRRMQELVEFLAKDYFVILDAPPLLPVTDAALLSRISNGALIVLSAGQTTLEQARSAIRAVDGIDGHVIGTVLNRASTKRFSQIAYGDAEYGYSAGVGKYKKYKEYKLPDEASANGPRSIAIENSEDKRFDSPASVLERPTVGEPPQPPVRRRRAVSSSESVPAPTQQSETQGRPRFLKTTEWKDIMGDS
ncbi:MAG: polysaccharide biosynthesis tyrosine autokinase [Actinomycetaceae bacterium]|nr:polysaccharide biosynthesis tyrosine autokinase [Actinomycetaceae bacterium]